MNDVLDLLDDTKPKKRIGLASSAAANNDYDFWIDNTIKPNTSICIFLYFASYLAYHFYRHFEKSQSISKMQF